MKRLMALMAALLMTLLAMNTALGEAGGEPPVQSPVAPEIVMDAAEAVEYRSGVVLKTDSSEGLLIYDMPGGQCIAAVEKGAMIEIAVARDGWVQICWEGLVGFVSSDCVALYNEEAAPEEQIRSICIYTSLNGVKQVREGTVVSLTAVLTGFENDAYTIQWQYSPDGGSTAVDIDGANKLTYAYRLTADNFGYMYRVVVHIAEEPMTAED